MQVVEIAAGLWRWTAPHPDWTPEQGGSDGWEADVGCVYCEANGAVLLVDPLVPDAAEERKRFWEALDRDLGRAGVAPDILLTCAWHARSTRELVDRYPDASAWSPAGSADELPGGLQATTFESSDALPGDVQAVDAALPGEVVFWLPSHGAVVSGDTLIGDGAGGVRLCPDSWLESRDPAGVRSELWGHLRDLPIERVLVSHGEPVLEDGHAALLRALD